MPCVLSPTEIELHNIPSAELSADGTGWVLPRYPRRTYQTFSSPGFLTAQESTGGELRFVTDARHLRVFLSAMDRATEVTIYKGDFLHATHSLSPGVVHCLQLTPPDNLADVRPEALFKSFHPDVWRVVFDRGSLVFHGIDTFGRPLRPPLPTEKPRVRWLAYGSSITHASLHGYPHRAARLLGVDVLNKGQSGSCYIEPEAVDFLASGCDWDFATLELGVNLRRVVSSDEFERRARRLVARCLEAKPGCPVVLITLFPNAADYLITPDEVSVRQAAFRDILRSIARENRDRNVHLVEGSALLDDFTLLGTDLLHPADHGHARMAENLARILTPLIASLSLAEVSS